MSTEPFERRIPAPPARERWEEPSIVLERSLQVSAQQGGPFDNPYGQPPAGLMGPLNTSGGVCY